MLELSDPHRSGWRPPGWQKPSLRVPPLLVLLLCSYPAATSRRSTTRSQTLASGTGAAGSEKSNCKNTVREMGKCVKERGAGGRAHERHELAPHQVRIIQGGSQKFADYCMAPGCTRAKRVDSSYSRQSLSKDLYHGNPGFGLTGLKTAVTVLCFPERWPRQPDWELIPRSA